jgi:cephalosporin-C deacetylase-like acetyl esterase
MFSANITSKSTSDGVVERAFTLGEVPGVIWSPEAGSGRAPLVLVGHGAGTGLGAAGVVGRARRLVLDGGFAVVAIDAPGHGDRQRTETDEREVAAVRRALRAGEPAVPIMVRYIADIAARAVPEWRAVLDSLLALPEFDGAQVGYFGLNMGTAIGVPLTAVDSRITAAVFGQFWPGTVVEAAGRVTVPVEFLLQWDDERVDRESALALFDAFASKEKSLHANSGGHKEVPRFETDSMVRFFTRHLRRPSGAEA